MKTHRKILMTLILIITAALLLTASAFAKEYMLSEELIGFQVTGHANGTQKVYSYTNNTTDDILENEEIIFKGEGSCFIDLLEGAKVTLNSVNIANSSPVYVYNNANAVITIRGDNTLINDEDGSDNGIITVNDGNLTIKGDGKLTLVGDTNGAKIGSESASDMSGTIHITDNVEIITDDEDCWGDNGWYDGACIGSGYGGDFTGEVKIDGNAKVKAYSNYDGAGIGSGSYSDFTVTGKVIIEGNANVTAISGYDGAGIGSGCYGDFAGQVIIGENAIVNAESDSDGAGIGSGGYGGDFTGEVKIDGKAKVEVISGYGGAGIGSGCYGCFEGIVTIGENAIVNAESDYDGAGIGSGYGSDFTGQVIIEDSADVTAVSAEYGAGIGAGDDCSAFTGTITIKDSANVTAIGQGDAPAVGAAGDAPMDGTITIEDNAVVTVCSGDISEGCIIGANSAGGVESTGTIKILGEAQVIPHEDNPYNFALIGSPFGSFTGDIIVDNSTKIFGKNGIYVNLRCYVPRNDGEIVIVKDYADPAPPPAPAPAEPAKKYEIKLDPNRGETTAEKLITDENGKVANFPDAQRKGYVFMGWYDALTGGKKVDTNTVFTKNTTIYAMWKMDIDGDTFAQKKTEVTQYLIAAVNASSNMFTVSVKSSDGGWINPKETRIINYGGKLTVSAFPDGGKKVVSFIVDGEDKGSISTYTFKNIRENHTVEVVFG